MKKIVIISIVLFFAVYMAKAQGNDFCLYVWDTDRKVFGPATMQQCLEKEKELVESNTGMAKMFSFEVRKCNSTDKNSTTSSSQGNQGSSTKRAVIPETQPNTPRDWDSDVQSQPQPPTNTSGTRTGTGINARRTANSIKVGTNQGKVDSSRIYANKEKMRKQREEKEKRIKKLLEDKDKSATPVRDNMSKNTELAKSAATEMEERSNELRNEDVRGKYVEQLDQNRKNPTSNNFDNRYLYEKYAGNNTPSSTQNNKAATDGYNVKVNTSTTTPPKATNAGNNTGKIVYNSGRKPTAEDDSNTKSEIDMTGQNTVTFQYSIEIPKQTQEKQEEIVKKAKDYYYIVRYENVKYYVLSEKEALELKKKIENDVKITSYSDLNGSFNTDLLNFAKTYQSGKQFISDNKKNTKTKLIPNGKTCTITLVKVNKPPVQPSANPPTKQPLPQPPANPPTKPTEEQNVSGAGAGAGQTSDNDTNEKK